MSVCTTTAGNTTSSAASSTPTTSTTKVSSVPRSAMVFGALDGILVFFVSLAVNGAPLFDPAFERGIQ